MMVVGQRNRLPGCVHIRRNQPPVTPDYGEAYSDWEGDENPPEVREFGEGRCSGSIRPAAQGY